MQTGIRFSLAGSFNIVLYPLVFWLATMASAFFPQFHQQLDWHSYRLFMVCVPVVRTRVKDVISSRVAANNKRINIDAFVYHPSRDVTIHSSIENIQPSNHIAVSRLIECLKETRNGATSESFQFHISLNRNELTT